VRADSVRKLSEAGREALLAYGVRTVVDLRLHSELEADPPVEIPVPVVHVPLFRDDDEEDFAAVEAVSRAAPDEVASTRAVYLEMLERFRENFARAFATVAQAPEGGVLVHCQGGKDRTGLISALLLRLVGVSAEDIAADYALSASNLASWLGPWIEDADDDEERERRRRISSCPPQSMLDVLAELERRYGNVGGYLLAGGATEADLERAQARLVR